MGDPFNMFIQTHYVELLCVVPGVMLLVGVASAIGIDPYLRKRQKRSMLVICLLELALMAQNYLDYLLCVGTPNIGLRIVDSIIGYSIRPIILLLFLRVAHPERSYKWEWGLVWANAAIYMTALFSDICFTINAKNHYEGGFLLLSQSCLIISLFLLSELVYQTIRDNNSTTRKYAWFPLFVAFIIVLALFADGHIGYIDQPVSFLTIAIVISCALYYFWLHLQFVREHEAALADEQRFQIMMTQIQPNFLYNTLSTIRSLCLESPGIAARTIEQFSKYLRQNLETLNQSGLITFAKELDHTRIYTEIEKLISPFIQVKYDIEDENFMLPALTVQPLVENAIRHGVRAKGDEGMIIIRSAVTPGGHVVTISDNGPGFNPNAVASRRGTHIGIENVRERIERQCGGTLTVKSAPGKGTTVTIFIPDDAGASVE
ncbi:MAG: histidine kinase [Atopobiaceae bacterium]|nr:histidine kinase [Atopobiaceae bacterium]